MISSEFVCLFVSKITQNYSIDLHEIVWKSGARATEETVRFWR